MNWLDAAARMRTERRPAVLLTVVRVRGHAPREAGAKMVVAADGTWGSIGGGNLEASCVARARAMLEQGGGATDVIEHELTEHAPAEYGRQCCGGTSAVLLEPLPVPAAVAIVGLGHVGRELARILARHDLDLHLVDGRAEYADPRALPALDDAVAHVHWHHAPWPDPLLAALPPGTHLLVMTHDHREDAAMCDAALRAGDWAYIGLIGSRAKSRRIAKALQELGHSPEATARIVTPIGHPDLPGKDPATIALAVAVDLVRRTARVTVPSDARAAGDAHGIPVR